MSYTSDPSIASTPAPAVTPSRPSGLARGSFIAAIVLIVLALVRQVVSIFMPYLLRDAGYAAYGLVQSVITVVFSLIAIAVLVLGIVALATRREPRWAAGFAVGSAATVLASTLAGLVVSLLYGVIG